MYLDGAKEGGEVVGGLLNALLFAEVAGGVDDDLVSLAESVRVLVVGGESVLERAEPGEHHVGEAAGDHSLVLGRVCRRDSVIHYRLSGGKRPRADRV